MKRVLIVLLAAFLVIGLAACAPPTAKEDEDSGGNWGNKDDELTPQEEAQAEAMIEDMTGGEVDIDISEGGDSVSISNDEGEIVIEGDEDGMPWPSEFPPSVPELKGVKIVGKVDMGNGISIAFECADKSVNEKYAEDIAAAGWDISMNMEADEGHMIMAQKGDEFLQFLWSEEDGGGGTVIYSTGE